jgi:hypothetical protein
MATTHLSQAGAESGRLFGYAVGMFDEPDEAQDKRIIDPRQRAKDKLDEIRMHAQLAAVFEGPRKFDAQLLPTLDANLARDIQRGIGRLEKAKPVDTPVLPASSATEAADLLKLPQTKELSTNDYHIHRRPGEVMIVRWLQGDEVELFYERLQAHFDAGLEGVREDERQAHEWKQDPGTLDYLKALDEIKLAMAAVYLRPLIRQHRLFVLSTQTADEMNIQYLCDHIMSAPAAEVVGPTSVPADAATEQDLAWFFKLFALRGMDGDTEQMCFFTYLQKTDDSAW